MVSSLFRVVTGASHPRKAVVLALALVSATALALPSLARSSTIDPAAKPLSMTTRTGRPPLLVAVPLFLLPALEAWLQR
jgi:hypothetical protein